MKKERGDFLNKMKRKNNEIQNLLFQKSRYNNNETCVIYLNLSPKSRIWQTLKHFYMSSLPLSIPDLRRIYSNKSTPIHANTITNHIKQLLDTKMIELFQRNVGKNKRRNYYLLTTNGEEVFEKHLNRRKN